MIIFLGKQCVSHIYVSLLQGLWKIQIWTNTCKNFSGDITASQTGDEFFKLTTDDKTGYSMAYPDTLNSWVVNGWNCDQSYWCDGELSRATNWFPSYRKISGEKCKVNGLVNIGEYVEFWWRVERVEVSQQKYGDVTNQPFFMVQSTFWLVKSNSWWLYNWQFLAKSNSWWLNDSFDG
jgi:hypothetical protein